MPRKKQVLVEAPVEAPVEVFAEPVVETPVLCGHVNRHWTGKDEMVCILPVGHAGHHNAPYVNRGTPDVAAWTDEAGYAISQ